MAITTIIDVVVVHLIKPGNTQIEYEPSLIIVHHHRRRRQLSLSGMGLCRCVESPHASLAAVAN